MNDKRGETISALLDGELDQAEAQLTITGLLDGPVDDLAQFGRFRLIGDAMRGESSVLADSVVVGVRQHLLDDPTVLAPPRRAPNRWLRPVAGLAVAASVAAAAVVVAPQLLSPTGEPVPAAQLAADLPVPALKPTLVAIGPDSRATSEEQPGKGRRWQALNGALAERLNRLVIEHHEFGGRTGINGPVPHIGFVSYDTR